MIRRITGTAVAVFPTHVVVDVHGIGYLVFTTARTPIATNGEVTLHTHHAVRENAQDLYGFSTEEELSLFEELLSLPKIGPKSALQILSQADVELLKHSIALQDPDHLCKLSGISKKTAEKITLGLKDRFEGYALQSIGIDGTTKTASFSKDAIDALVALGYPQSDARKVIQEIVTDMPHIQDTNGAIKEALKMLG